jgi:hypothetical protein
MSNARESLHEFLSRQGGYELCAALLRDDRSRQELIELVDASEATIDRLLNEDAVHAIQRVPTTGSELVFMLDNSALRQDDLDICETLRIVHTDSDDETIMVPISRDNIDRSVYDPDAPVTYQHANTRAGYSKFISR